MTIGIIGAGISGLTLAYTLQQAGIDYRLWEARPEAGGYIRSEQGTGPDGQRYQFEVGPNSLLGNADLLAWITSLGLGDDVQFSNPVSKTRYIFKQGQYRKLPGGPLSLVFGDFFSGSTKAAILREPFVKSLSPPGETLADFFRRRFSDEIVDYAVGPFVAGIYAGDPEKLWVSETFPSLPAYEQTYGSVLKGFIKNQDKTARRQSFTFRSGLQTLPNRLAELLMHLYVSTPIQAIEPLETGWRVQTQTQWDEVSQLVFCTPAAATAQLLAPHEPTLSDAIRRIRYAPMTAVYSTYRRADVQHPLDGFGGLNPRVENRFAAGHIWSSSVFSDRCPPDEVLFTTFVGGDQTPEKAALAADVIRQRVHQELAESFGISAHQPIWQHIQRWEAAIPQYDAAAATVRSLLDKPQQQAYTSWSVCANWYGGVSLSDCIQKAVRLAKQLAQSNV